MSQSEDASQLNLLGQVRDRFLSHRWTQSTPELSVTTEATELGTLGPPAHDGTNSENETAGAPVDRLTIHIVLGSTPYTTVHRKLRGIHIFMITLNGVFGSGLYWRSGQILELAGPIAMFLSIFLLGALAWAIMQCITELLCMWPIPGALSRYVSQLVDEELGYVVGITYWFMCSVSFASLIAAVAQEIAYWFPSSDDGGTAESAVSVVVIYIFLPFLLIVLNSCGVEVYGNFEVAAGFVKISFLITILMAVLVKLCSGQGASLGRNSTGWNTPLTYYDTEACSSWGSCFMMSLNIAAYLYVGMEIVAASALEAKPSRRADAVQEDQNGRFFGSTFRLSSSSISLIAMITYTVSGLLVSFAVSPADPNLPRLTWIIGGNNTNTCSSAAQNTTAQNATASVFLIIATEWEHPQMASVFNAFLVFSALTCANTLLYVGSRTLFGLTCQFVGESDLPLYKRWIGYFGTTTRNGRKVPMRAMVFSALAFSWVPFLRISGNAGVELLNLLEGMSSVSCIIVWACECFAFIRYYHCIKKHQQKLREDGVPYMLRWGQDEHNDDYPYRSVCQPFLAYFAFTGCLFLLVVCGSSYLWREFYVIPFSSSFLPIFIFIASFLFLKVASGNRWALVDLSTYTGARRHIDRLNDMRRSSFTAM